MQTESKEDVFVNWINEIIIITKNSIFHEESDEIQIRLMEQVRDKYLSIKLGATVEQTVDAGQLFDEKADTPFGVFDKEGFTNETELFMSKEKFMELWNQRTPNAVSLKSELKVTEALLNERQKLLDAIPECPTHGKCVPYALEWIDKAKNKLPDAGQLEKIIGDAFDAGNAFQYTISPDKAQYIKQAIDQIKK